MTVGCDDAWESRKEDAISLFNSGWSPRKICEHFGLPAGKSETLRRRLSAWGANMKRRTKWASHADAPLKFIRPAIEGMCWTGAPILEIAQKFNTSVTSVRRIAVACGAHSVMLEAARKERKIKRAERNAQITSRRMEKARVYANRLTERRRVNRWHAWPCAREVLGLSNSSIGHALTKGAPNTTIGAFALWKKNRRTHERAMARARRAKRKDKDRAYGREYRRKNLIKARDWSKQWKARNRDKESQRRRNFRARPGNRIIHNLRNRLYSAITGKRGIKAASTMDLVGCSARDLRRHIEKQWKPGMSWENYGQWHVDHIIPCAAFNLMSEEDQRRCFHYTNLQPLWALDNIIKSARLAKPVQPTLALSWK